MNHVFQVLKVAILAEKYASDYTWYVDVILNLIRIAGDYVSEEVSFKTYINSFKKIKITKMYLMFWQRCASSKMCSKHLYFEVQRQ